MYEYFIYTYSTILYGVSYVYYCKLLLLQYLRQNKFVFNTDDAQYIERPGSTYFYVGTRCQIFPCSCIIFVGFMRPLSPPTFTHVY